MAATTDLHVKVKPDIEWPLFEYVEANSLGRVNEMAGQGWRLVAFAMSGNGVKVYVLERARR
jgi:hypothetical protein